MTNTKERGEEIVIRVADSLSGISREDWDACAGSDNPFVSHDFLSALEESKSVDRQEGWLPQHVLIEGPESGLVAAAPAYIKTHSQGEYIFDHAWADAYERAGGRYYPKLLTAVPFTPATGPRLLVRPDAADFGDFTSALASGLIEVTSQHQLSSLHINFVEEDLVEKLKALGFHERWGQQFHWFNREYTTFDDFLAALTSRKRKAIKKERKAVADTDIKLSALTGDDLKQHHWDAFFEFYTSTSDKKWGWPYLTREFFDILHDRMRDRVVMIVGEEDGSLVCGALNMLGSDCLFGRNWGCTQNAKFLHFEACYYQAIDFAIEAGLKRVEAGAQGFHKLQRGYEPVITRSLHWIRDEGFSSAIANFLEQERGAMAEEIASLQAESPFKK